MKITTAILLIGVLHVSANSRAQTITLRADGMPIKKVFEAIHEQTQFGIVYDETQIDLHQKITVVAKRKPLDKFLAEVLASRNLSYRIQERTIFVQQSPEEDIHQQTSPTIAPVQRTVSGRVTDEAGNPLHGVTITVRSNSQIGTTSGANGVYTLLNLPGNVTLVYRYMGYLEKEVVVGDKSHIDVKMVFDQAGLEEVVVVGYGTQRRTDITGAISSVDVSQLEGIPLRSADQAVQGRVSGVFMTQNGASPGASSSIRIRGGNSITGSNEPLYVIDGMPISVSSSSSFGINPLNSINPLDIESIEVLKDASATAIYGARGGNGVILITTKRGKSGESRISLDISAGLQQELNRYKLLDAKQFQTLANEASLNDGGPLLYDPDLNPVTTDWQGLMFRSIAPIQNYQLSASGGDEKTQYLLTVGYFEQEGIIHSSDMERYSMRLNLDRQVNDWVKLSSNLTFSNVHVNRTNSSSLFSMLSTQPDLPVRQADGSYTRFNHEGIGFNNPVGLLNDYSDLNKRFRGLGNLFADIRIAPGLTFKTLWGLDAAFNKNDTYMPRSVHSGAEVGGRGSVVTSQGLIWLNENTLDFIRNFGDHRINVLVGYTQQSSRSEGLNASATGFLNDNTRSNNLGLGNPEEAILPGSSTSNWAILSGLGRINYALKDRYLFTVNARYDGSSRFGSNNRWGFFPSAAFAWRAIEEDFIQNIGLFSDLKVRLSHGVTGNQDGIGNYPGMDLWGGVYYVLNDEYVTGVTPTQIANRNLRWESTTSSDVGLEFGFFGNRLMIVADAYYKRTTDLLLTVNVPATSGFVAGTKNIGSLENKGLEFTVNATPIDRILSWKSSFNISFNRNKILDLGVSDNVIPATSQGATILKVGEPLGNFYGYISDGLFQSADEIAESAQPNRYPGDVRFVDFNGDKVINADDMRVMGNAQPKFYGGFMNSFAWKGFDLSVFLQFVYGNSIFNQNTVSLENLTGRTNQNITVLNRWTPENRNTVIPRATATKSTGDFYERYVEDGSYLRIKNVQLAYNIPVTRFNTGVLRSLRLSINVQNLFTFTSYSGMDPEANRYADNNVLQGYDSGAYPNVRTVTFGLSADF